MFIRIAAGPLSVMRSRAASAVFSPSRMLAALIPNIAKHSHTINLSQTASPTSAFRMPKAQVPQSSSSKPRGIDAQHSRTLEAALQSLPFLTAHRARADAHEWYETRPYAALAPAVRAQTFTAGTLRGAGKLAINALVRARKDESESVVLVHLGRDLCGHAGIVHGGMVAALLDEGLGRAGVLNTPEKVGFTASMTVEYRAPTLAEQFVAIKTRVARAEGRKVWIEGVMEDLAGKVLAEAKALYIQPAQTDFLDKTTLHQFFGEPECRI